MKIPLAALLLLGACTIGPSAMAASNYARCILDTMPGISNSPAMLAARDACEGQFPWRFSDIERGSGRGLFGYSSARACISKEAGSTQHSGVAMNIIAACRCLYGKAAFQGEKCAADRDSAVRAD